MSDSFIKAFGSDNSLVGAFFATVLAHPDKALLHDKRDGQWQVQSYSEVADKVVRLASYLRYCSIQKGDRVLICSENRSEWAISDLAIMAIGAIAVPAYTTNTVGDHHFILEHAEVSLILCSGGRIAERLSAAAAAYHTEQKIPLPIICFDTPEAGMLSFDACLGAENALTQEISYRPDASDIACIIYTSGTGGRPKGVMLTHASIQANIDAALDLVREGRADKNAVFLSLLPLSHSYEHTGGMHLPLQIGAEIWYCSSPDQVASLLQEVRPTIMTAVPRLYEALHDRITRGVAAKGGVTQRLFEQAIFLGKKQQSGLSLGVFEQIQNKCLDVLVRRKVRARFGGRLAYFVSGGAALNSEIGTFFLALGVNILQGYGQTEASPLVSANRPSKIRIDTVGPAVRGVSVKIAADGELLVQGACVMKGYWRDDDATAEALRDGWLYTGDLAKIEDDGYITIRGRKKDIIVTSGGDNIAPAKIEAALTFMPEIEQVMIYGDKKAWLSAVIVPSEAEGRAPDTVKQDISRCIDAVNKTVPQAEKIRRFLIADEPFTTENGQMTPTLKVKRLVVTDIYLERLNALYKKS